MSLFPASRCVCYASVRPLCSSGIHSIRHSSSLSSKRSHHSSVESSERSARPLAFVPGIDTLPVDTPIPTVFKHLSAGVTAPPPSKATTSSSSLPLRRHIDPRVSTRASQHPSARGDYIEFPLLDTAEGKNPWSLPSRDEWAKVHSAWDAITLGEYHLSHYLHVGCPAPLIPESTGMVPREMLHQKPIDLRHKCLFYIGHIPTFCDMVLSRAIGEPMTDPKHYLNIFERGIDPHVDDPDHCHRHSEVPEADEDWPSLEEILAFRNNVRARLFRVYDEIEAGTRPLTRNLARTLVMALEHEGWHIETLLYMLIQRSGDANGTLPPPGPAPQFASLASTWSRAPLPDTPGRAVFGSRFVVLGHDDVEADDERATLTSKHTFGWDNESPARYVEVKPFEAEWRPITNEQYRAFWETRSGSSRPMPSNWTEQNGDIMIRTLYGPVPFSVGGRWPCQTSYDDLEAFAQSKGGRLPTEAELRLFLDTYETAENVGFKQWHPVPSTTGLAASSGKGSNGGVWEWTTTKFDNHPGLSPTNIFPGYSTDFFDDKHRVVLGGSYATIPRIGQRRTARNFYQHNYPYPWVGARVVYDL